MQFHAIKNTIIGTLLFSWILFCSGYPPAIASAEGWRFTTSLDYDPHGNPVIGHNAYLYTFGVGGYDWALINSDGTLGNWTTKLVMLYGGLHPGVATTANLIYVTGGRPSTDVSVPPIKYLWYAGFNPDGSLANIVLQDTPKLQTARWYHSSLILNGRIYCFGGYNDSRGDVFGPLSSVEFGPINTDSSVGPFQYTSSFSQISGAVYTSFNFGDTVYCFGSDPQQSTTYLERSIQNPDGTLSPWSLIAGPFPFAGLTVLTSRTTLFVIQNYIGGSYNNTYKTEVSPINGINNFIPVTHPLTLRSFNSMGTWNRFVYWMGGQTSTSASDSTVEFYDPDLADTELFSDPSMILPSQSAHILEIPLDMEKKNE